MELKTMPNVLKKFERVIESVDLSKNEEDKSQLYTVTLDKEYTINGKSTNKVTGKTVKEVRSIIRSNRVLSTKNKEEKPKKVETKLKEVEDIKEAKSVKALEKLEKPKESTKEPVAKAEKSSKSKTTEKKSK